MFSCVDLYVYFVGSDLLVQRLNLGLKPNYLPPPTSPGTSQRQRSASGSQLTL